MLILNIWHKKAPAHKRASEKNFTIRDNTNEYITFILSS